MKNMRWVVIVVVIITLSLILQSSIKQVMASPNAPSLKNIHRTFEGGEEFSKPYVLNYQKDSSQQTQPTALSPTSQVGITNGGFENGRDGSWTESSSQGWDLIIHADYIGIEPHSGSWAVWLGGDTNETSIIMQTIQIPLGSQELKFWYWIDSWFPCGSDIAKVMINNNPVTQFNLCQTNNTTKWQEATIDISALAGTTAIIEFRAQTTSTTFGSFFIDDVAIYGTSYSGNLQIFLPLTTKNHWSGFFDDFNDPNSGWGSGEFPSVRYGYHEGEYQFYFKTPNGVLGLTPDLSLPEDYKIEVLARKASGISCSYGLIFGTKFASDSWETYQVIVDPYTGGYGGYKVQKRLMDGTWITLQDWFGTSRVYTDTRTNHIKVVRVGSKIRIYINYWRMKTIEDNDFIGAGRDAGIRGYSYNYAPVDIRFDSFLATQPP